MQRKIQTDALQDLEHGLVLDWFPPVELTDILVKRVWVGFELNHEYTKLAQEKITQQK